jgi:hypothetical protein
MIMPPWIHTRRRNNKALKKDLLLHRPSIFFTVLDDYLTEETKATFLQECAAAHYQSANMDEMVSQYRGNIDEFSSYVED